MKLEQKLYKLSREDKLRLIRELQELLRRDNAIIFAYLHGSILLEASIRDIDIAVWLHRNVDPLTYVIEKGLEIEQLLRLPIDIQVLNLAPVTFRYMVYTRGLPIIVKNKELHDLEIAKTILMYLDLKALRKSIRRSVG